MISVRSEVQVLPGPPFYGSCAARLSRKRARRPFGLAMPSASFADLSIVCERPAGPQARTRAANFFASGLPARGIKWGRSSVGRAVALQASGRRFDPVRLHQKIWFRQTHSSTNQASLILLQAPPYLWLMRRTAIRANVRGGHSALQCLRHRESPSIQNKVSHFGFVTQCALMK